MALNIGTLVGYVTIDTSGVRSGAARTNATMATMGRNMGRTMDRAGVAAGHNLGTGVSAGLDSKQGLISGAMNKAMGVLALGVAGKAVIGLEATYGKTMAQIAASTGAPKSAMKQLNDLALQLGADTSFSAGEAAGAMLELSKAGISTSDIMGGALAGTLTLAAAGGTDLATASTIASNAMNTFSLKGEDMASIAAALAGGANASSASVESLGQALQQVGPGATNAGLSLNETVAALAAFDAAGIKGSDAGTSLKTMLANLVPQTEKASNAMKEYNLDFVDADGNFVSLANMAKQLKAGLGGLSEAKRTDALSTIFGSDASRAATVLMKEGAKGIKGYVKATENQTAAQEMANANMSGSAGAIERMKGSIETAGLVVGKVLAPATVAAADSISAMASGASKAVQWFDKHRAVAITLVAVIGTLTLVTKAHAAAMGVSAAGGMAQWLMQTKLISTATKVWTAVQWAWNAAVTASPIGIAIVAIAALIAIVVIAWKKSDGFKAAVIGAFNGIKTGIGNAVNWVLGFLKAKWPWIIGILTGPVGLAVVAIAKNWTKIKSGASSVVDWIKGIPGKIGKLGSKFGAAGKELLQSFIDGMKNAAGIIEGIAGNVWNAVKGLINGAIAKINDALEFEIDIPGPNVHVNLPDIPQLATGGRATSATLAVIGEGREPESVLPDSVLRGLLEKAHAAGAAQGGGGNGRGAPLIGTVVQSPDQSPHELAENLWFLTHTRG